MSCSCWGSASEVSEHDESSSWLNIGQILPAPKLIGRTTAHKSLKSIWDLLMDNQTRIISVHGMVGVGKTAIMMNVYNQLLYTQPNQFNKVIWVNASNFLETSSGFRVTDSTFSFTILDEDSGRVTDSTFNSAIFDEYSGRGVKALRHFRKNFVLILDDLRYGFSFDKLGLTKPNKKNGCKLVFTSRSLDVCREMECKQDCIVKVELLTEKEALELFWDKVGMEVNPSPMMTEIAEEVVKECARLALVIVTMGNELRGQDEVGWGMFFCKLRNSVQGILDIASGAFENLDLSQLEWPEKNGGLCLIFCALYPKDWEILRKELIEYWIMDGLIEGRKRQDEIDKCEKNLMYYKNNCYLESVEVDFDDYHEWGEGIQMHTLYWEFGLKTRPNTLISKCGLMLEELPNELELRQDHLWWASFTCNNIRTISNSPKCSYLSILLLNKNPDLCTISHHFFVHLTGLRILDLRDNHRMEILPDSVSDLIHLRALRLSRCWSLKRVPSLAKLLNMKMLELDETAIEELPCGIELLVNLKFLKLHSLRLREPIPSAYLSVFLSLPDLELEL